MPCSSHQRNGLPPNGHSVGMLFGLYPDLEQAYWPSQNLRGIFNKRSTKDCARLNLARWYNRVADSGFKSFNTIAATLL